VFQHDQSRQTLPSEPLDSALSTCSNSAFAPATTCSPPARKEVRQDHPEVGEHEVETVFGFRTYVFVAHGSFSVLPTPTGKAIQGLADATKGRQIAESLCSTCHVVDASPDNIAKSDVSSFYSIANKPDQSQERLAGAIIFPHPAMPKVSFTKSELRDVIAYILSLKEQKPAAK
jgi:cytochrome c553